MPRAGAAGCQQLALPCWSSACSCNSELSNQLDACEGDWDHLRRKGLWNRCKATAVLYAGGCERTSWGADQAQTVSVSNKAQDGRLLGQGPIGLKVPKAGEELGALSELWSSPL